MNFLELLQQFGPLAGACLFVIHRDRKHEDQLTARIKKLEESLLSLIAQ